MDSSTSTLWTGPFLTEGVSGKFFLLLCFVEIPLLNANCVDPDQMPYSAASDLGLHCLPMSLFGDAWHKWINVLETLAVLYTAIQERFVQNNFLVHTV